MPSGAEDKPESEEKDVNPSVTKVNSEEKKAITNENSEEKKGVIKEKSEEKKGNLKPVDPKDQGTDDQSKEGLWRTCIGQAQLLAQSLQWHGS